ncbi:MAG: hypothetical protein IT305_09700 [Chloroflexi bacterium]|nr:hypothetical protein [Chloroflexota bacterium]
MSLLHIATRGLDSWRQRLAAPEDQWKRGYSAFETAVSWEKASISATGLPDSLSALLRDGGYQDPRLLLAVAEHKVPLPGGRAASQNDVWALVSTSQGMLSMAVEAKASEAFGDCSLKDWLEGTGSDRSAANRKVRWDHVRQHLPNGCDFEAVRYQLLHRCASAVIEAQRFGLGHAAFVVQAFGTPDRSFKEYEAFCLALGLSAGRGKMCRTSVLDGVALSIGWADCPLATDADIAKVVTESEPPATA